MDEQTRDEASLGLLPKIVIGILAAFGAVTLVSWLLGRVIGFVKFGLFVVLVVAIVAWVLKSKTDV